MSDFETQRLQRLKQLEDKRKRLEEMRKQRAEANTAPSTGLGLELSLNYCSISYDLNLFGWNRLGIPLLLCQEMLATIHKKSNSYE